MSRVARIAHAARAWLRRLAPRTAPAASFHERLSRQIRCEDAITLRVSTVERSVATNPSGLRAATNQE